MTLLGTMLGDARRAHTVNVKPVEKVLPVQNVRS